MNEETKQDSTSEDESVSTETDDTDTAAAENASADTPADEDTPEQFTAEDFAAPAPKPDPAKDIAFTLEEDPEEKEQTEEREAAARAAFFAADDAKSPDEPKGPVVFQVEPPPEKVAPPEEPPAAAAPAASAGSDADEEEEIDEDALIVDPPDDGIKRRWFAIHAHSGQEANVKRNILAQAELDDLLNLITNILVPMEQVEEFKTGGEKKVSKRKFFPGYVLIQLPEHPEKSPELWHLIKDTPGVTGFIGSRNTPVPLEDSEVQAIVEEIRGERERPKRKVEFELSERVKITDGPFANFLGNIDEINEERGKLKVLVEIFERQTSVEVDYWQVEKI